MLVHVPADKKTISMIHFPRDLYVDIPGHGKNKINAAYAFGREPLLVQTMEDLLKIRIHHVAKTDFAGFKNMTDAVGGVRVCAEEASDGTGNGGPVVIKKGWNTLNGEQALAFVRERYELSEGDISRGRRQLAFIKALMLKATSAATLANPVKFARITERRHREPRASTRTSRLRSCATSPSRCATSRGATCTSRRPLQPGSAPPRVVPRSTSSTRRAWPSSGTRCAPTRWTSTPTCSPRPERTAIRGPVPSGPAAHSTRLSSADTCDWIGWPTAAMSMTQSRSLLT